MSMFSGLNGHQTSGNVGIAVIGGLGGNISFQNFHTDANRPDLHAYLTINGNFSKKTIDLGLLPQRSGSFTMSFPANTDMSLFNVLVIRADETSIGEVRVA